MHRILRASVRAGESLVGLFMQQRCLLPPSFVCVGLFLFLLTSGDAPWQRAGLHEVYSHVLRLVTSGVGIKSKV